MKLTELRRLDESALITNREEILKLLRYNESDDPKDWEYSEEDLEIDDHGVVTVKGNFHFEDDIIKNGKLIIKFAEVQGDLEYVGTQLKSFENFPKKIYGELTFYSECISDFRGVADYIDTLVGGFSLKWSSVKQGGIGLALIDKIQYVSAMEPRIVDSRAAQAYRIINDAIQDKTDLLDVQEELMANNLDKYAEI